MLSKATPKLLAPESPSRPNFSCSVSRSRRRVFCTRRFSQYWATSIRGVKAISCAVAGHSKDSSKNLVIVFWGEGASGGLRSGAVHAWLALISTLLSLRIGSRRSLSLQGLAAADVVALGLALGGKPAVLNPGATVLETSPGEPGESRRWALRSCGGEACQSRRTRGSRLAEEPVERGWAAAVVYQNESFVTRGWLRGGS
mmetsp:Transcript_129473/g.360662  ORF Transcript_129473/g.360662 Transcript_129473/m.360662 type:complete len:200 (-) Transcript_129473:400-999(-)